MQVAMRKPVTPLVVCGLESRQIPLWLSSRATTIVLFKAWRCLKQGRLAAGKDGSMAAETWPLLRPTWRPCGPRSVTAARERCFSSSPRVGGRGVAPDACPISTGHIVSGVHSLDGGPAVSASCRQAANVLNTWR